MRNEALSGRRVFWVILKLPFMALVCLVLLYLNCLMAGVWFGIKFISSPKHLYEHLISCYRCGLTFCGAVVAWNLTFLAVRHLF